MKAISVFLFFISEILTVCDRDITIILYCCCPIDTDAFIIYNSSDKRERMDFPCKEENKL